MNRSCSRGPIFSFVVVPACTGEFLCIGDFIYFFFKKRPVQNGRKHHVCSQLINLLYSSCVFLLPKYNTSRLGLNLWEIKGILFSLKLSGRIQVEHLTLKLKSMRFTGNLLYANLVNVSDPWAIKFCWGFVLYMETLDIIHWATANILDIPRNKTAQSSGNLRWMPKTHGHLENKCIC